VIMIALIRLNGYRYALETRSIILVATVILVLVLIRFQKHNFSFNSVLVRKIILVVVLVIVNDWQ